MKFKRGDIVKYINDPYVNFKNLMKGKTFYIERIQRKKHKLLSKPELIINDQAYSIEYFELVSSVMREEE